MLFAIWFERKRRRPHAAPARPEPGRPVRPAAVAGRRHRSWTQGRHRCPDARRQGGLLHRPGRHRASRAFLAFSIIPFGPMVIDVRRSRRPCSSPTCRSRCCWCWRWPRSASTASCSPAGPRGSTYPLLGGLRSAAQMISYEVAMGLSFVAVFLYAGTMSTSEIVSRRRQVRRLVHRACCRSRFLDLLHRDGRRDQPGAVRPARGRGRAGRRLPHRVLAR